jgi:hypothetical protein
LYGYETWSLTLREEHRLKVFEDREQLRRISGRGSKMLQNEELNNMYTSPNVISVIKLRNMRWIWHVARMGKKGNVYNILV